MKKDNKKPKDHFAPNKGLQDRPPAAFNLNSQESSYGENNKPEADNNLMFEERSNPLSSKGN